MNTKAQMDGITLIMLTIIIISIAYIAIVQNLSIKECGKQAETYCNILNTQTSLINRMIGDFLVNSSVHINETKCSWITQTW